MKIPVFCQILLLLTTINLTLLRKRIVYHTLFLNYDLDLNLENFNSSGLNISFKKVSNDSYLGVFDQYITKSTLRPGNFHKLTSEITFSLDHENYNFQSGATKL